MFVGQGTQVAVYVAVEVGVAVGVGEAVALGGGGVSVGGTVGVIATGVGPSTSIQSVPDSTGSSNTEPESDP